MKLILTLMTFFFCIHSQAEELRVSVRNLPAKSILIGRSRNLIPSVFYRIEKGAIIFTGKKDDINFLKQVVDQKTLMPFFEDAYQELIPVSYPITFQIRDPLYLIDISVSLNCRTTSTRQSHCSSLGYYTPQGCMLSSQTMEKLEMALKVTTSLEEAKNLKVVTDNPCLNPRTESLYDFALKDISHRMGIGDLEGSIEINYEAYRVVEQSLELL